MVAAKAAPTLVNLSLSIGSVESAIRSMSALCA
jgi:hypothetical protein